MDHMVEIRCTRGRGFWIVGGGGETNGAMQSRKFDGMKRRHWIQLNPVPAILGKVQLSGISEIQNHSSCAGQPGCPDFGLACPFSECFL